MKKKIHFIRHGSVLNPEKILYGRLAGFPLSPKGISEAKKAAVRLKDKEIDAIYTSPMLRARQTAEAIFAFHDAIPLKMADQLNEVFTPYQGMNADDLKHLNEDFYTGSQKPYEQPTDIVGRVKDFIRGIRKQNKYSEVAAVTHGDIILFLIMEIAACGLVVEDKARMTLAGMPDNYPATASITTLAFYGEHEDETPKVTYWSSTREREE